MMYHILKASVRRLRWGISGLWRLKNNFIFSGRFFWDWGCAAFRSENGLSGGQLLSL